MTVKVITEPLGFTLFDLKVNGYTASQLKLENNAAFSLRNLIDEGYTRTELLSAGYTDTELANEGIVNTASISAQRIKTLRGERLAGKTITQMRTVNNLSTDNGFENHYTPKEFQLADMRYDFESICRVYKKCKYNSRSSCICQRYGSKW